MPRRLDDHDPHTQAILGAAIDVHRELGPGLLESAYEQCLCHELHLRCIEFQRRPVANLLEIDGQARRVIDQLQRPTVN